MGKTLNTDIRVGNYGYAGAPFYKTGSATDCDDVIYIPVIAKDGATAYTVTIDFGSSAVYLYGAELVTVTERF